MADIRPEDKVWLVPHTATAPNICYKRPTAKVVRVEGAHVVVKVKGERKERRIHRDNVRQSDPSRSHGVHTTYGPRRPQMPEGFQEVPLW